MDAIRIQSKFLVASPTRVLHPAQMVVRRGRVVELTQRIIDCPDIDLGETVLIPGLVNAHTHLEFSSLRTPFPVGESFPDWIAQVVGYRRALAEPASPVSSVSNREPLPTAIGAGLRECFASGTGLIGDIVTSPWTTALLPSPQEFAADAGDQSGDWDVNRDRFTVQAWREHFSPLRYPRVVAFAELLGLQTKRFEASWRWAAEVIKHSQGELLLTHGLSPHAPYSIHFPAAKRKLDAALAAMPWAMHVAESPAELEWLSSSNGPFQQMFSRLGIAVEARPPTIEECIDLLSRPQRGLLVHGNYLTRPQMEQVASAPGITIVYCPRTHAHFAHEPYPLRQMREAGLRIVLGTDSRASNPDLSLWDEVVLVKQLYPWIAPSELLDWVTRSPAQALGAADDYGTLEVGRLAHACAIRALPHWTTKSLVDELSRRTTAQLGLQPLTFLV